MGGTARAWLNAPGGRSAARPSRLAPTARLSPPPFHALAPCPPGPPFSAPDCLKEMNDMVAGSYVDEDPHSLMTSNPAFFAQFTLVLATQVHVCICVRVFVVGCVRVHAE